MSIENGIALVLVVGLACFVMWFTLGWHTEYQRLTDLHKEIREKIEKDI